MRFSTVKTPSTNRVGGTTLIVVAVLVTVVAVGAAALVVGSGDNGLTVAAADEFTVRRGSFDITIPASGELAAQDQIEIRNRLEYRAVLTWIIPEGDTVAKGDILFRLADEEIRNKIKDAEDAENNALNAKVTAESNLDIRISATHSEQARADLDVTLAELALLAWTHGEVISKQQDLGLELETAQKNYERLNNKFEESKLLVEKQFISNDEFRSDEIRMIEAHARLKQAKLSIDVYENYQYKQDEARKNSDLEQARAERERVADRHKAELETVRANVASKRHQLQSRIERLAELRKQLEYCTVQAPADGWVVYASSIDTGSWRGNDDPPSVGTELRRNDLVIVLPDTSRMIARVKVNEALSGLVEPGQPAVVTSDAIDNVALQGEVISIGVLAESGGWIDRNRRDYTVKILLRGSNDLGLKPSMRCKADIYVGEVDDALFVPLQAVFREGPSAYVYVPQRGGFAQRSVTLGESSGLNVEIVEGLDEGESVLLREPTPREIVARLPQDPARDKRAGSSRKPPRGARADKGPNGAGTGG